MIVRSHSRRGILLRDDGKGGVDEGIALVNGDVQAASYWSLSGGGGELFQLEIEWGNEGYHAEQSYKLATAAKI
jgi:hypothetical protein